MPRLIFLAFLPVLTLLAAPARAGESPCGAAVAAAEAAENLPPGLLLAIAKVESGRGPDRTPWPWTTNAAGRSYYFETKTEAVADAQTRLADGSRRFDVGCVQINLHYHPAAFTSLEEAFDPEANAAYGARFLNELFERYADWGEAVARYHSPDNERQIAYAGRVLRAWALPGVTAAAQPAAQRPQPQGRGPLPKLYTVGDGGSALARSAFLIEQQNGVDILRPGVGLE